jgi:hypothetical protein
MEEKPQDAAGAGLVVVPSIPHGNAVPLVPCALGAACLVIGAACNSAVVVVSVRRLKDMPGPISHTLMPARVTSQ